MRKCFGGLIAVAIAVCLATSAFAQNIQVSPSDKTITAAAQTVMDPTPDDHGPIDPSAVSSVVTAGDWGSACCDYGNSCCPQRRILVRRTSRCCTPVNTCCAAPVNTCCQSACNTNDCCRRVVARGAIRSNRCCNVSTNACCVQNTSPCCGTAVACGTNDCCRRVVARPAMRNNCCNVASNCCPTTGTMTASNCCTPTMATYCNNPAPATFTSDCGGCNTSCCGNGRVAYAQPRLLARLGGRRVCR